MKGSKERPPFLSGQKVNYVVLTMDPQYAHDLAEGEDLMEELGKCLCQDTVPAGESKNKVREQPRPSKKKVPTSIHLA